MANRKLTKSIQKHKSIIRWLLLLLVLFFSTPAFTQTYDSSTVHPGRMRTLVIGTAAGYSGLLLGLNALWYQDHPQTSFHFFNDTKQWMRVDKMGHTYSAFHLSRSGSEALLWAGMDKKKAGIYGSISGFLLMLPIEILDGYSAEYGASWGDLAANSLGSILYGGQIIVWDEVRLRPKFSFHPTPYATERPNVLGQNFPQQLLKDYNGQTYWLSADIHKFLPKGSKYPPWLNLAFGFGTQGMVYAHPAPNIEAGYHPTAQFFIGPDLNLSYIQSRKRGIRLLLFLLDSIKLPAPALEVNKNRMRFHPVYF